MTVELCPCSKLIGNANRIDLKCFCHNIPNEERLYEVQLLLSSVAS